MNRLLSYGYSMRTLEVSAPADGNGLGRACGNIGRYFISIIIYVAYVYEQLCPKAFCNIASLCFLVQTGPAQRSSLI